MRIAGLDLANRADYTGLVVVDQYALGETSARYEVRLVRRWRGDKYRQILGEVAKVLDRPEVASELTTVAFDLTGIGVPLEEVIREIVPYDQLYPVMLTSGRSRRGRAARCTYPSGRWCITRSSGDRRRSLLHDRHAGSASHAAGD